MGGDGYVPGLLLLLLRLGLHDLSLALALAAAAARHRPDHLTKSPDPVAAAIVTTVAITVAITTAMAITVAIVASMAITATMKMSRSISPRRPPRFGSTPLTILRATIIRGVRMMMMMMATMKGGLDRTASSTAVSSGKKCVGCEDDGGDGEGVVGRREHRRHRHRLTRRTQLWQRRFCCYSSA